MTFQGIIVLYSTETGEVEQTKSETMDCNLAEAIAKMMEKAKEAGKFYKQIFIKDEAGKNRYYKSNFQ